MATDICFPYRVGGINVRRFRPSAIDLFSGCGGLTLGLKRAGFNVIGAVELDASAVAAYQANHRGVYVWQHDIRELTSHQIKSRLGLKKGELDLLAGCPPCQGFSTMRTLNGGYVVSDNRNDLIFDFLRIAEELLPKTIMLENVPALAKDRRFRQFCRRLETHGYCVNHSVLDAADYGVPQRRRRTILLAGKNGLVSFARKAEQKTVADALKQLPPAGTSGDPLHDTGERRSEKVKRIIALIPKDGGSRSDLPAHLQLSCHKRCDGFKDVYGRMAWNKPAPTITSGCTNPSKGRFLHPEENRAITLREAAVLQGFPTNYRFDATVAKGHNALLIGNALPVEFVRRHARELYRWLLERAN